MLTLNKYSDIFVQWNAFIREQQRIAIQDMPSNGEPQATLENEGKEHSFIEERESSEGLL